MTESSRQLKDKDYRPIEALLRSSSDVELLKSRAEDAEQEGDRGLRVSSRALWRAACGPGGRRRR